MKILIVHNDYGKYSGEEAVVDRMKSMFIARHHKVAMLRMSSASRRDTLSGKIAGFFSGLYSKKGIRAMKQAIAQEKPDIINVHNLYPFISPAALKECKKAKVPVIMTVHNFRLICPTGLFLRDGNVCEDCLRKGNEWSCIRHNCENSLPKSFGYAARNAWARKQRYFIDNVDIFACITEFQRSKLIEAGFDASKIRVIPNMADHSLPEPSDSSAIGEYVSYCGRISNEKGIDLLIQLAERHPEIPFKVAGECRDNQLIQHIPKNMALVGYLSGKQLSEFYRNSKINIMTSRCYEGFPTTLLEAAKYSKPSICPSHGGFTEIIGKGPTAMGLLFKPGDIDSLDRQLTTLWNSRKEILTLGNNAYNNLISRYSTEAISMKWEELLSEVTTGQPQLRD